MRNFQPHSVQQNENLITRNQRRFDLGALDDIPASEIPINAVKYVENYVAYSERLETRGGTKRWSDTIVPSLVGRTGYSFTKAGSTITKTVGSDFVPGDVGNFIVHDAGDHERITAFISTTQVTVGVSTAQVASTVGKVRGPVNGTGFHIAKNKIILHIDERFFISDINIIAWTQVVQISPYAPTKTPSTMKEKDNFMFIFNANGIFRIDFSVSPEYFFKINTPVPGELITEVVKTDTRIFARKYVTAMVRLSGTNQTRDRTTANVKTELLSGTTAINQDGKDFGVVYTVRPVGPTGILYGILTGNPLLTPYDVHTGWSEITFSAILTGGVLQTPFDVVGGWSGISDGTFNIFVNGVKKNITVDFTGDADMDDVAASIQTAIQVQFSQVTVVHSTDHFVITAPNEDDTISVVSAGTGGTDIGSSSMECESGNGVVTTPRFRDGENSQFTITVNGVTKNVTCNFIGASSFEDVAAEIQGAMQAAFGNANITCEFDVGFFLITIDEEGGTIGFTTAGDAGTDIGSLAMRCDAANGDLETPEFFEQEVVKSLRMPVDPDNFYTKLQHWTHHSIWATLDIGVNGINPINGRGNNDQLLVWLKDVSIAKAFTASRSGNTVTATEGVFSQDDIGSTIKFENAITGVITTFVSSTQVTVATSGTVTSQSAAIGSGVIFTASQTGTTVTISSGLSFTGADIGTTLFWANGLRTVITSITSSSVAEATTVTAIASMGVTANPLLREFNDNVSDDQLRTRIAGLSLPNRFWKPLPGADVGEIVGVFLFSGIRGEKQLSFSQMIDSQTFLAGYHHPGIQLTTFKDSIQYYSEFKNLLVVYCSNSTKGIPTNIFTTKTIPEIGEVVAVLAGQRTLDPNIGVEDWGSIRRDHSGLDYLITHDRAFRRFNGEVYSDNLANNRIHKRILKLNGVSTSSYDDTNGYMIWDQGVEQLEFEAPDEGWKNTFATGPVYVNKFINSELIRGVF